MGRGGKRPGAGRPKGTKNVLPTGVVKAIRSIRHRVPEGLDAETAAVADEALGTVVSIMRGEVRFGARERLAAAAMVREEVCGAVPKQSVVKADVATTIIVKTGIEGEGPPGGET